VKVPTNEQKQRVWQAYRDRKPTRVPVTYGINPRVVLFDPKWNPRGISFQEYATDAAAAVEVQLQFMEFQSQYLNQYCDSPLGRPEQWEFYVDNQNTYDSAYFGAPVEFRDGQVADVSPYLAGAGKHRIFEIDIDHPLDNPFIKHCLRRYEALKARAAKLSYKGVRFAVRPPLMGFDGHFTIAVNLRGPELLTDLYEDPDYVRRLMEFIHRGVVIRNRALAGAFGRKAFEGRRGSFADDSIQLVSNPMYRELILPLHRAWYALWSAEGPHSIHLCGDATRHFPTIREELNVDSFDTGFPVDHGRLREALGEDVEILGGPEAALLLNGTAEQVFERTRQILSSGVMRGGRFVLREANNLPPGVPEANLAAMYGCCLTHGNYTPSAGS
jgi:uroporphyrinogen-III decarboxylase